MPRALILAAALAALAPAASQAAPSAAARQCFFSRDWQGWRATQDEKSLYARVRLNDVYRIDFANGCPGLRSPGARLITSSPTGQVCSAIDLDVKVGYPSGIPGATPCIVSNITHLTAAEAKALPKNLTP